MSNQTQNPVVVLVWAAIGSLLGVALMKGGWEDLGILILALIGGVGAVVLFWVIVIGLACGIEKLWGNND